MEDLAYADAVNAAIDADETAYAAAAASHAAADAAAADAAAAAAHAAREATYATYATYAIYAPFAADAVRTAMWRDYDLLIALKREFEWTDESPVDPDLLGSLWPFGKPVGWPEEPPNEDAVGGFKITFTVPDGVSDEEAFRMMEDYVLRLNALHRALGGKGLRISPPAEVTQPARTKQGVGA